MARERLARRRDSNKGRLRKRQGGARHVAPEPEPTPDRADLLHLRVRGVELLACGVAQGRRADAGFGGREVDCRRHHKGAASRVVGTPGQGDWGFCKRALFRGDVDLTDTLLSVIWGDRSRDQPRAGPARWHQGRRRMVGVRKEMASDRHSPCNSPRRSGRWLRA